MTALEMWRRRVLDNPGDYDALERAAAWEFTAREIRERRDGDFAWAADIAEQEAARCRAEIAQPLPSVSP